MGKKQSKRSTLKDKYKIQRKCKEFKKKQAKIAKLKGNRRPKEKTTISIPNMWPHKDQLLRQIELQQKAEAVERQRKRQLEKAARERKAAARKTAAAQEQSEMLESISAPQTAQLVAHGLLNDTAQHEFRAECDKLLEAADVCLVVLDARDPMGCRCPEAEAEFRAGGAHKRIVLVLNKVDLVSQPVATEWLKVLRKEYPTVAFKANTSGDWDRSGSEALGSVALAQLIKQYAATNVGGPSGALSVGVIGQPNVGKSSLVNSLKKRRAAHVGNTPGMTKVVQEVPLEPKLHVNLLDCPSVIVLDGSDGHDSDKHDSAATTDSNAVSTPAAVFLRNCAKVDKLADPVAAVGRILAACVDHGQLMMHYKISEFENVDDFLVQIADKLNLRTKKELLDSYAAARAVLGDWVHDRIQYFTSASSAPAVAKKAAKQAAVMAKEIGVDAAYVKQEAEALEKLYRREGGVLGSGGQSVEITAVVSGGGGGNKRQRR